MSGSEFEETMNDHSAELLHRLAQFPNRIASAIEGLSDEQVRWKPSPAEFSILENIAHMRDLETEATAIRIRRLLSEEDPLLVDFDGTAVAAASRYNDEIPRDAIAAFSLARRRNIHRLQLASDADFLRSATYGDDRISLAIILERLRAHDAEHGLAIEEIAWCLRRELDHFEPRDRSPSLV